MAWPEHRIDDWHHFQQVANDLLPPTDPSHVPFLFRGNSTTFPDLTPSLTRFVLRLTPEDALGVEEQIGRHFRSLLHLYAHAVGIDSLMPTIIMRSRRRSSATVIVRACCMDGY